MDVSAAQNFHMFTKVVTVLILAGAAAVPALSLAQSMTVLGGDSYARDCYMSATFASQIHTAAREDIDACTKAIEYGRLSRRDLHATYVNRGVLHVARKDHEAAAADYATAIDMDPESAEAYVNRGNLFYIKEAYGQAVGQYSKAISLGLTRDHIAYYNRAMAHEHMRDYASARADYERAVELAPEWYLPKAKLDRVQRLTGNSNP